MMSQVSSRFARAALSVSAAVVLAGCFGESSEQLIASARSHIEKQDTKAAIIQLKNALQKDAKSAEARYLLGKLLLQGGDVAGAKIELDKAAELGFDKQLLAPEQARVLLLQGQAAKVIEQFGQMQLADAKKDAELKLTVASAFASSGNLTQARELVGRVISASPDLADAQLLNVRLLIGAGQRDEAGAAIDQLLVKQPDLVAAWLAKGDVQLLQGKGVDAASASYQEALKRDAKNLPALGALFRFAMAKPDLDEATALLKRMQAVSENLPQVRYFAARLALARKDLPAAREQVQALLKLAPKSPQALHLAGVVSAQLGEHAKAETYLKQALQLQPSFIDARVALARAYVQSGDAKKALATVGDLLDAKPPVPQAVAIAAEAHLLEGDAKKAEQLLALAAKLNPKDMRSRTALALTHLQQGNDQLGFEELRELSSREATILPDMALISALERRKDFVGALKAIDSLERKTPEQPIAQGLRGRIELLRGDREKARQHFEAALKLAPGYLPALTALAGLDTADKRPQEAIKRFEAALQKEPRNVAVHMALVNLKQQSGASKDELLGLVKAAVKQNPEAVPPRLALVAIHLDAKDAKSALSAAQEGAAAIPDNVEMLLALAQAQQASGDANQAMTTAGKAAALQPESPVPLLRMAELQMAQKDANAALQTLKKALALKPENAQVQGALVAVARQAGRADEARSVLAGLHKQLPRNAGLYALEGDLEMAEQRFAAAAKAYRSALDLQDDATHAIKWLTALRRDGRGDEARRQEALWAARNPKDAAFAFYQGDQALASNDLNQALARYKQVLELRPDNAVAANNVAWILNKTGKPGAMDYARKANAQRPDFAPFLDTLAEVLAREGKLEEALQTQQKAVSLEPGFHPHRLHLADLLLRAGKKAEAAEQLKQLAALGDKFPLQDEVKRLQAKL